MAESGFSTGCLYKTEIPIGERINFFSSIGADAIELSFASPKLLEEFRLIPRLAKDISRFGYISVHAPWYGIKYGSDSETKKVIAKLSEISRAIPVRGIVIHPDTITDFSQLNDSGLQFLIENMDIKKEFGRLPENFEQLKKEQTYNFILDVFHAYENDSSMELAYEFLRVMDKRLQHLHVSGIKGEQRHSLTYNSDNRELVSKVLSQATNIPRISEGLLCADIIMNATRELEFLKSN